MAPIPPAPLPTPREPRWDSLATRWCLPLIVAVAATFIAFGLLAYTQYPAAYSPLTNTLSELGNRQLNPHGAVFYLLGSGLAGALTVAFFLALTPWKRSGTPTENRLLTVVQFLGVLGGFALIMTAVFPEDVFALHRFWSNVLFNSLGIALVVSVFALRREGHLQVILGSAAVLTYTIGLASMILPEAHWLEWANVGLSVVCGCLVAFRTRRLGSTSVPAAH